MKVGVVRNPASGRGSGVERWPALEANLRKRVDHVLVRETSAPGTGGEIALQLLHEGCDVIAAAGGDGTLCEVLQPVVGSGAALAIIPLGTGNDFARTLGMGTAPEQAIDAIVSGRRWPIDIGRWSQGAKSGYFINVAGCGFDGEVARRVNQGFRSFHGRNAFLAAILQTLIRYRATKLRLTIDGEVVQVKAMLSAIANARSYGGGMMIAPNAKLDDGLLDLVVVGDLSRTQFVMNFSRVLRGTHLSHPRVIHRQFRHLTIESEPDAPFLIDGELLGGSHLMVDVVPKGVAVIAPN